MKIGQNRHKMEALASIRAQWRGLIDDVGTAIQEKQGQIYIPDLNSQTVTKL